MGNDLAALLGPFATTIGATLAMYAGVLLLARISGVRSFAELSTFDVAVTIGIGSLIASTVISSDAPVGRGLTAAATLYAIQLSVSRLRARWGRARRTVDNGPLLLVGPEGDFRWDNMDQARVTEDDIRCHMRQANVVDPARLQAVVIEGTGRINVIHGHDDGLTRDSWILRGVRGV